MKDYLSETLNEAKLRFTPFRAWIGDLRDPAVVKADIIAGTTVALVLIPQAMAYAELGGLPASVGVLCQNVATAVAVADAVVLLQISQRGLSELGRASDARPGIVDEGSALFGVPGQEQVDDGAGTREIAHVTRLREWFLVVEHALPYVVL